MKKLVSIVIGSSLILTSAIQANMLEELQQVQEKYKDAFKRQEALHKNPDFSNKFRKIQEQHENDLKAFQAKYKTSPVDMYDAVNKIKEQYKHAFDKEQDMHNNPEYDKEREEAYKILEAEISKIDKKYNPLYDEFQKAYQEIEKIQKNFWSKYSMDQKAPSSDTHKEMDAIRQQHKQAFDKHIEMFSKPEYQKEIDAAQKAHNVAIDKIDKKYNPHYDELEKANQEIEKIQNNFWAQKNDMLSNKAYQADLQAIGDKSATAMNNLLGEYDPELQKASQEITAIVKKHQTSLRPDQL